MTIDEVALETSVCTPIPLNPDGFNEAAELPYGLAIEHIKAAMVEFVDSSAS